MTAPAAAPSSAPAPVAPPAPRASPHPPADGHAFAAMLDSLPSAASKASASTNEQQHGPSDEAQQDQPRRGHAASHPLLNDGALLMSLPFALRAASLTGENPTPPDQCAFAAHGCDAGAGRQGQRDIHRRERKGGELSGGSLANARFISPPPPSALRLKPI